MVSHWDGSLGPDVQRTFEESIEWHEFEEELLAVAERQAAQNPQPSGPVKAILEVQKSAASVHSRAVPMARRYGFEANMARHRAIVEIVTQHAQTWRQGSKAWKEHHALQSICTDLDKAASLDESGLYEIPESWKKGGKTQALGGAKAKGWSDALQLASQKLVVDQINASLKMVLKHGSTL
jgi:hypothetical protein